MRHAMLNIYWVDFSQNVKGLSRVEHFRTPASERWKGQIKVELSPWISIALKMPVASDDHKEQGGRKAMHVKLEASSRVLAKIVNLACRLAARREEALWGSDGFHEGRPARRGRLKGSRHRADSEKSAKLMLVRRCLMEGMYHRSFVQGEVYVL